jgi:hypothetical protein
MPPERIDQLHVNHTQMGASSEATRKIWIRNHKHCQSKYKIGRLRDYMSFVKNHRAIVEI